MSIGEVLEHIHAEFPDVRASKVRFLEERGLMTPARSASGYRKYTQADVDRLRFILALQRDQFLPLKVIKDYLDAIDAGKRPESLPGGLRLEPRSVSQQLARLKNEFRVEDLVINFRNAYGIQSISGHL